MYMYIDRNRYIWICIAFGCEFGRPLICYVVMKHHMFGNTHIQAMCVRLALGASPLVQPRAARPPSASERVNP